MTATFDPKKDAENLKKHGVSLTEGDGVLSDPLAVTIEDDSAEGEQRFVTLGANTFGALRLWSGRLATTMFTSSQFESRHRKGEKEL